MVLTDGRPAVAQRVEEIGKLVGEIKVTDNWCRYCEGMYSPEELDSNYICEACGPDVYTWWTQEEETE